MALIAGTVDVAVLLRTLALRRPVYHSEADFQHAFAWETHRTDPSLRVRLETHPEPDVRLDLLLSRPDLGLHTPVELKYLTAGWVGAFEGEHFALKNHGAQDVRGYEGSRTSAGRNALLQPSRAGTECSSRLPMTVRFGDR